MRKKILMIGFLFFVSVFAIKNVNADTYQFNLDYDEFFSEKVLERLEYIQKEFVDSGFLDQYENYYIYVYSDAYYIRYGNVEYSYYANIDLNNQKRTGSYFIRNNSNSVNYGCQLGYMSYTLDQFKNKVSECKSKKTPTMSDNSGGGVYPYFAYFYLYSSNKNVKKITYDEAILLNSSHIGKTPVEISINGKLVNDIYKSYLDVSVKFPELKYEMLDYVVNEKDIYTKKVMRFSFQPYDPFKYHYYVSYDGVSYYEFPTEFLDLTFTANGKVYFKVTNTDFEDLAFYSYEVNDIGRTSFLDPSLDISDVDIPEYSDLENGSELPEEPTNPLDFLQWFKNLYFGKFPIVNQVKEIYDKWSKYTPYSNNPDYEWFGTARCADIGDVVYEEGGGPKFCDLYEIKYKNKIPRLKINLSFLKIDKEFEIVDMGVLLKYRNTYYPWIYLSLGTITLLKVISNVKKMLENWSVD